ncbi:hypothetical protein [Sphingomonas sp.]|uniref:hypothetical protein n=1 Tax=Sphingomonas sp. TaxID=28214 RepID=UPI001D774672|nr:hypothetical protein [Sphingomonas sp.]MBX9797008.1 hypothetical protein [Sphingomonas sp.]
MRALILTGLLAGCASAGGAPPPVQRAAPVPIPTTPRGAATAAGLIGRDARALIAQFGQPAADMSEGRARKLQFVGTACVLDAYLYPKGSGAPVVTHVDTRQRDGSPIDRAACAAALSRRGR